jgi:hypothetical protein
MVTEVLTRVKTGRFRYLIVLPPWQAEEANSNHDYLGLGICVIDLQTNKVKTAFWPNACKK